MRGLFKQRIVKAAGLGDGNGKDTAEAVDHVKADDQGDPQPALLHGDFLELVILAGVVDHHAADAACPDIVLMIVLFGVGHDASEFLLRNPAVGQHLADLLLQRHSGKKLFHESLLCVVQFHFPTP